ncbi:MAG: enoyl-CoA hydratase/isomerase family protein [Candidatus Lokiarchaeota archaeon]|nr:enoyl-CoA hydratase/isomerase family protein [Candidatus Lokiarchaeota archaeon]
MNEDPVLFEQRNKIGIITFNRPDVLNCFNIHTLRFFNNMLNELNDNEKLKVIIVTGKGRAFSTGNDLKGKLSPEEAFEFTKIGRSMCLKILNLPAITIAAVNGFALGGGFEIAMSTDFRIASENAVFGLPEVSIGLLPIWSGLTILPRLIGIQAAKEIIITGKKIDVEKAKNLGLINEIFPSKNFMDSVMTYAKQFIKRDPILVQMSKYVVNRALDHPLTKTSQLAEEIFEIYANKGKKEKLRELRKEYFV